MRDVGPDLIQVYLFVSPQKKKNEKTRVQKKHRCKVVRKLKRKDKTRQDIVTLQVQLFGTQLARKR